jgi:zinc protease
VGDNQMVQIAYHIPALAHADTAALSVLAQLLGDTPGGRLHKALVEPGKAVGVGAWNATAYDPNLLSFFSTLRKNEAIDVARDTMIREIDTVAKEGVTPGLVSEVERVKTKILKQFELGLAESDSFAVALSESIAAGDWRLFFLGRDRVREVSTGDVVRVAQSYLKADNRTIGMFIPTEQPDRIAMPPRPDIVALLKDYKGDAPPAEGEAFEPSYANMDVRTTRVTLANGIKLALLPKKTRGNTVNARVLMYYGDEQSLTGRTAADSLAGAMLMRSDSTGVRGSQGRRLGQRRRRQSADHARESGAGTEARRRNSARARVSGIGVRAIEAGGAGVDRKPTHRAGCPRRQRTRATSQPLPARQYPLRADFRRKPGRIAVGGSQRREKNLFRSLRCNRRRSRGGRRFRPRGSARASRGIVCRLGEPASIHPDCRRVQTRRSGT